MDTPPQEPESSIRDFLYDHETASHLAFYSAIGRVIVLWGDIEHVFSLQVMFLYHSKEASGLDLRPPYQLSKKIGFWRKCFDNVPYLAPWKKEAHKFANALRDLAKKRDQIVHFNFSVAIDDLNNSSSNVTGRSIMGKDDGHYLLSTEINLHELTDLAEKIADLKFRMIGLIFFINNLPSNREALGRRLQSPTQL